MPNNTRSLPPTSRALDGPLSDWLSQLDLAENSEAVYLSMLSKFASWAAERDITFATCQPDDIENFLNQNGLEKEHRYRYVRLIERLYMYLSAENLLKRDNPGSKAAKEGVGQGSNDRTCFLTQAQYTAVAEYIARPVEEEKKRKNEKDREKPVSRHWSEFAEWKLARDKALASVMLFGALKVSEAGLLSVNCITFDGRLAIQGDGRIPNHDAVLLPEGKIPLDAWIARRQLEVIPGSFLFPSNDLGEPMHPASIYRRVHKIAETAIQEAGLDLPESRLSPQTLRNTYASILLERGFTDMEIMKSMGIKEARSMARLKAAIEWAKSKDIGG